MHESKTTDNIKNPKHQHSSSCGSLSTDLLGPVIMGPAISVDDWVPERPPKKPHLRTVYPDLFQEPRVPSPDLPPPSPPVVLETEVFNNDEPLPPPPTEIETAKWEQEFNSRLKKTDADEVLRQTSGLPDRQIENRKSDSNLEHKLREFKQPIPEIRHSHVRMSQRNRTPKPLDPKTFNNEILPTPKPFMRSSSKENFQQRHSFIDKRYNQQKLIVNGNIAVSQKVNGISEFHTESLRGYKPPLQPPVDDKRKPPAQLPGERNLNQRSSYAERSEHLAPPPLHPRQMRVNQSMRARISEPPKRLTPPGSSPPRFEEKDEVNKNNQVNFNM